MRDNRRAAARSLFSPGSRQTRARKKAQEVIRTRAETPTPTGKQHMYDLKTNTQIHAQRIQTGNGTHAAPTATKGPRVGDSPGPAIVFAVCANSSL